MLKLAAAGVWVAVVTAGSAYLSAGFMTPRAELSAAERSRAGLEQMVSDMTSVPVVRGNDIAGYIILQVTFEADKAKLSEFKIEPQPYLADAIFRSVYDAADADFTRLKAADIDKLLAAIAGNANAKMGGDIVAHVLVKELNYVRKEDIRTHWIKQN